MGFTADTVVEDFKKRIQHYADQYETLDEALEPGLSFIKIFNAGEKVLVHKHEGHIQSRVVYYLMNINLRPRTIYLTRHGELFPSHLLMLLLLLLLVVVMALSLLMLMLMLFLMLMLLLLPLLLLLLGLPLLRSLFFVVFPAAAGAAFAPIVALSVVDAA